MISNETSFHQMKENIRHSYVSVDLTKDEFHSQRNQTSHSMEIGSYNANLKEHGIEFHIKYPVQGLLSHFRKILNSKGFKVTQVFPGKLLVVKLNLFERIKYIFAKKRPHSYLFTLQTYEYKSVRKLHIQKIVTQFQEDHEEDHAIQNIQKWIQQTPLNVTVSPLNNDDENEQNMQMDEYQQDMYSLEATATYMYHKIFVDSNYSIGKKMKKLIQKGKQQNQASFNHKQIHQLPLSQSKIVIGAINQITDDMLQNFNCTRKQLLQILCHCRSAVEDFYHHQKYTYKSKQQLIFQQSQIQNGLQSHSQLQQYTPLTVKIFKGLIEQKNSFGILRGFFMAQFIFNIECELNKKITDKKNFASKIGKLFEDVITEKTKILEVWGYSNHCWDEYISIFC